MVAEAVRLQARPFSFFHFDEPQYGPSEIWGFLILNQPVAGCPKCVAVRYPAHAIRTRVSYNLGHCLQQRNQLCRSHSIQNLARDSLKRELFDLSHTLAAPTPKSPGCTAFFDILERLKTIGRQSLVIIISDGEETCGHKPSSIPAPPAGVRAILVLVSSTGQRGPNISRAEVFQRKSKTLATIAPWLVVAVPWDLSPRLRFQQASTYQTKDNRDR